MRPCGPVRPQFSSVRKATVKNYEFQYWTDSFMCSGQQVGGTFKCLLSSKEATKLQKIAVEFGRDYGDIKEHAPEICEKMELAAYKALEYRMAEEAYGYFDFSDPKFKGWRKVQKIRYIMSTANEPASSLFSIGFEIPEGFQVA